MHNDTVSLSVWLVWASLVISFSEQAASQRLSERSVGGAPVLSDSRPEVVESSSYREAAADQWSYFGVVLVVAALLLVACAVLTWCWDWKGARQEEGVAKESASLPAPSRPSVNFQTALSQSDCAAAVASPRYPVLQPAGGASYGATPLCSSRLSLSSRVSLTPTWLCPQLTVPVGTELHCVLPSLVSGVKQNLVVQVCSIAERGSRPLFQARLVEADGDLEGPLGAAILLETPGGEGRLACVSTREVWARTAGQEPKMEMTRASGAKFGTIKKNEAGGYTIAGETGILAVYCGHVMKHEMRVSDSCGATLAEVTPGRSSNAYDVVVYPNVDAGLITLGLLAIEKKERIESGTVSA